MTTVALEAFPAFYDNSGNPLSGGKIYTFQAGTSTPLATYTDRGGATPNANPVVLDSAGRASIWLQVNTAYKIRVDDAVGNVIATVDNFYAGADPAQLTAAGIVPATGGIYFGLVVFEGGVLFSGDATENASTRNSLGIASAQMANLAVNSDMAIWQTGTASVPDATNAFDRFVVLCSSGNVTMSQLSQPADGIPYAMRQTQPDVAAKRMGWCQQYEAKECIAYRGEQLVFAPKVRCSIGTTIRAALVAWTGAIDAPPRDVVNNWASTTYTAGNFFIANTLPIAVGAVAVTGSTWTDIPVSSASAGGVVVPSTMNNLYVVIWTDATVAQNVTLDTSVVRVGRGTEIPIWTPPNPTLELAKCQRTFETGFFYDGSYSAAGLQLSKRVIFKVAKRAVPTLGFTGLVESNASGTAVGGASVDSMLYSYTVTAAGTASSSATWNAYAGF